MLAIAFEQLTGGKSHGILDCRITVDKRQAQPPGKAAADGRLSNSHQPYQHYRPVKALDRFTHQRGYTAACRVGKSAAMPRIVVLIVVLVLIIGALVFLSTSVKEQP